MEPGTPLFPFWAFKCDGLAFLRKVLCCITLTNDLTDRETICKDLNERLI